ncbi:hypothetical protein J437_LFUL012526 [Ladona fulva]|uniref:Uncharacterized protein n=1 Tax=Ladona fulva TaxID=123851 RepID=A0A8K0P4V9_LADFU|nr:hypothetical protein J437_LFUL012526 [Ladona fulva]
MAAVHSTRVGLAAFWLPCAVWTAYISSHDTLSIIGLNNIERARHACGGILANNVRNMMTDYFLTPIGSLKFEEEISISPKTLFPLLVTRLTLKSYHCPLVFGSSKFSFGINFSPTTFARYICKYIQDLALKPSTIRFTSHIDIVSCLEGSTMKLAPRHTNKPLLARKMIRYRIDSYSIDDFDHYPRQTKKFKIFTSYIFTSDAALTTFTQFAQLLLQEITFYPYIRNRYQKKINKEVAYSNHLYVMMLEEEYVGLWI